MGFFLRWLCAFLLLGATYNPTPYNFVAWTTGPGQERLSLVVLFGVILTIGYIIYMRATLRSIGGFGMILVLALVGASLWVAWDFGLLSLENPSVNAWIGIFALSVVLGVGLSWSHVRRALSGQADVDDVQD